MKFHIVGNGESIKDILNGYELTIEELKNENKHIRNWNYLIPGTKLKIPVLTEALVEELNEIEPFIEDYYPKIKLEEEQYNIVNENEIETIIDIDENKNVNNCEEEPQDIQEEINEVIASQEEHEEQIQKEVITNNNQTNNRQVIIRYVYPQPYFNGYYRPIVYVIPRN